jgi:hypothetical protein
MDANKILRNLKDTQLCKWSVSTRGILKCSFCTCLVTTHIYMHAPKRTRSKKANPKLVDLEKQRKRHPVHVPTNHACVQSKSTERKVYQIISR